ncbi:unnamed protein product [Protopolystoma xenopodis]|uniref:Uncharacterized protein n=1 Tax=Protopolystoma xenopodis TaxID=117903 RepID=A0A3S5AK65_9PLAT|nr:unnamed protein product [Protopolystoma xenopodis]
MHTHGTHAYIVQGVSANHVDREFVPNRGGLSITPSEGVPLESPHGPGKGGKLHKAVPHQHPEETTQIQAPQPHLTRPETHSSSGLDWAVRVSVACVLEFDETESRGKPRSTQNSVWRILGPDDTAKFSPI